MGKLSEAGGTSSNYAPVIALHAAATTLDSTNAFHFSIKGKLYTATAWTTAATPTTDYNTGAAFVRVGTSECSVFVIGLQSDGTIKVMQGTVEALDSAGTVVVPPQFPTIPDDVCPVGYVFCKAGSTAAAKATGWLFGTSNFSGVTGITLTAQDLQTMPSRVVTS